MKTEINKSVKRAISLVLAFVLLIGTLFTANIGVNIKADAETETTDPYADWDNVQYWDGTYLSYSDFSTFKQEDVDEDGVDEYIIETAEQLQLAAAGTRSRNTNWPESSLGKEFVIDPTVDAFIMQPKEVVDKLGIAAFVEASSAEETRELFEDKFAAIGETPNNWVKDSNALIFSGDFDGSGVPIYGLYADGVAKSNEHAAFFLAINAGGTDTTYADITLENIVIKNSYFKSYRRTGILTSIVWGDNNTCTKVDSCVFANCYLFGQNKYTSGSTTYLRSGNKDGTFAEDISAMGIVTADVSNAPIQMSNTLVYGNACRYDFYTATDTTVADTVNNPWLHTVNDTNTISEPATTYDAFNWVFRANKNNGDDYGSIKNCIILDTVVNNLQADSTDYCENVYSDTYTTYVNTVTKLFDGESTKGSAGMYWMSGLNWGNDWFAVEGEYPSPFEPDNYDSSITASETGYNGGNGTEDEPYIISSADQLYQMVTEQSYSGIKTDSWTLYNSGATATTESTKDNYVSKYYKVADGVDAIYINDVETKAEVEELVAKGSSYYNLWNPSITDTSASGAFSGHFDGNGVTIYGMISTSTGFVNKIDGENATIKNVYFKAAYVSTSGKAAVVTTDFGHYGGVSGYEYNSDGELVQVWKNKNSVYTISNVAVTESYIKSTLSNSGNSGTGCVATAGGIVAIDTTPPSLKMEYCLFDGGSCTLIDGDDTAANYSTSSSKAGIFTTASSTAANNWALNNCVAINAYAVSMQSGGTYGRYTSGTVSLNTVYGVFNSEFSSKSKLESYGVLEAGKTSFDMLDMPLLNWGGAWLLVDVDDDGDGKTDRTIPMPKTSDETVDDFSQQLANQNGGKGATNPSDGRSGGYTAGTYGFYQEFVGSGTKDDPYIISNALDLARAIACGGKDVTNELYYKLSCDIDVGASWINEVTVAGKYVYVPFVGHIDGDGHTIYNLYSTATNASLIPVIVEGATVKNLHIRNSYINSTATAGAIFGTYQDDPNSDENTVYIEGCSYENSDGVQGLVGDTKNATIKNSYYVVGENSEYYLADGTTGTPTVDYTGNNAETAVWYKGGKDDCMPQLVNRAKAMTEVDVSGYGDNDYDSNDIAALIQRLLGNEDYKYVYGDVSRNGVTNMGDLAILTRQLVGTYNKYADGFWRNAALGNIVIYYGENDNYDFARKLELALENEFGKDVKKVVVGTDSIDSDSVSYGSESGGLYVHKNDIYTDGTNYYKLNEDASTGEITYVALDPKNEADAAEIAKYALDGNCQIVVGNIGTSYSASLDDNNYQISYDKANSAVWLQGGSFTAVEQATIDFINNSNPDSSTVHTTNGAVALDTNKEAKTVDGTTYYYAWGDEFNSGSLNKDLWNYDGMHNESNQGTGSNFENLEVAFPEDMEKLYTMITDETGAGKLKIWRGYYAEDEDTDASWGYKYLGTLADKGVTSDTSVTNSFNSTVEADDTYVTAGKICTNKSMLVKQGYLEMKVTYPEDGHAFPCWWLLGHSGGEFTSNAVINNSLFGKVFKLNNIAAYNGGDSSTNAYDGTTNTLNSSIPSTFKYQLPNASYEIDIVEFMQGGTNAGRDYKTANFTFHKFYGNGAYTNESGVKAIKFLNWDNILTTTADYYYGLSSKATRSGRVGSYTYSYDSSTKIYEFYPETTTSLSGYWQSNGKTWNGGMLESANGNDWFSGTPGTVTIEGGQEYIFGVEWDATDTTALYTFTVDKVNADGTTTPVTIYDKNTGEEKTTFTIAEDIAYTKDTALAASGNVGFLENLSALQTDQKTANQYMYMLIDNTYYTALNGSVYDDLLSLDDNDKEKIATMEIDYVRVYQQKRDIVTPDTEEFNNGNHFGY